MQSLSFASRGRDDDDAIDEFSRCSENSPLRTGFLMLTSEQRVCEDSGRGNGTKMRERVRWSAHHQS